MATDRIPRFPFLFGGTFIEGVWGEPGGCSGRLFPFLFGGTFIEGQINGEAERLTQADFPSFSEGLSLRGLMRW